MLLKDVDHGEVDYSNEETGSIHFRQLDPFDEMQLPVDEARFYREAMISFGDDGYLEYDVVDEAGTAVLKLLDAGYGEHCRYLYRGMSYWKDQLGIGEKVVPGRIWSWSGNIGIAEEFAENSHSSLISDEVGLILIYDGNSMEFIDFSPWSCNITEQEYLSSPEAVFEIAEIEGFDPDHDRIEDLDGFVYARVVPSCL